MKEELAKIWFAYMAAMFIFTCFLGNGWLIGLLLGLILGFVNFK